MRNEKPMLVQTTVNFPNVKSFIGLLDVLVLQKITECYKILILKRSCLR